MTPCALRIASPLLRAETLRARLQGVVAKSHSSLYRPGERGWVKVKNPSYRRRDAEREAMTRKRERRARTRV